MISLFVCLFFCLTFFLFIFLFSLFSLTVLLSVLVFVCLLLFIFCLRETSPDPVSSCVYMCGYFTHGPAGGMVPIHTGLTIGPSWASICSIFVKHFQYINICESWVMSDQRLIYVIYNSVSKKARKTTTLYSVSELVLSRGL